jgi:nucleoside-diphosphate-sugar epimerase
MTPLTLVTGGTGFVGRHVVSELQRRGIPIRAVIRSGTASKLPGRSEYESIIETPDLFAESHQWWQQACTGVDTIIHLAWYAEPGSYLTSPLNLSCLRGTLALAEGAIPANINRFVGVGTCAEYDVTQCLLSTATKIDPSTPYAATKAAAFIALSKILPAASISFAWCRLFYLFGEGEDPRRLVPYVRAQIAMGKPIELTKGDQIRDYLDITEAARQIVAIAFSTHTGPANICSGKPVTVRQLVESIADETGNRSLLRFGARAPNLLDPPCVVGVPTES